MNGITADWEASGPPSTRQLLQAVPSPTYNYYYIYVSTHVHQDTFISKSNSNKDQINRSFSDGNDPMLRQKESFEKKI